MRRPLRQPVVVALSMRLRDMGNGVDRIESGARIPFDRAVAGADAPGCEPLPQPTPTRIKDAVLQVLGSVGISAPPSAELLIEGYLRPVCERSVDLVAWMALLA